MASAAMIRHEKLFNLPSMNTFSNEERKPQMKKLVKKVKKNNSISIPKVESSASQQLTKWLSQPGNPVAESAMGITRHTLKKKKKKKMATASQDLKQQPIPTTQSWVRASGQKTNITKPLGEDTTKKKKMGVRPKRTSKMALTPSPTRRTKSPKMLSVPTKQKNTSKKANGPIRMSVIIKNLKHSLEVLRSQIKAVEENDVSRDSIHLPVRSPRGLRH